VVNDDTELVHILKFCGGQIRSGVIGSGFIYVQCQWQRIAVLKEDGTEKKVRPIWLGCAKPL
jgi:hypothetical protein